MSGYIAPFYMQQFRYANGLPLAGGSITTYSNQTSIPKAIYYDIYLQNACPNPLSLDSAGFAPEFYLGEGLYTFVIKDSSGNIIATRDYIAGSVSSVDLANISATSAAYKIKIDSNDTAPGYIWDKLSATNTIDYTNTGDKIAINVKNPWKVKASGIDNTPGYLSDKIGNTSTINLSVSSDKLYAEYTGPQYVFENSPTISWITSGNAVSASVIDSGKIKISSGDTLEYLEEKIQAGSGIVFTQTEDVNGKQIHISTTNSTTNAGKVKVTSADTLEYLSNKIEAGPGIIVSASDNKIIITSQSSELAYITSTLPFTSAVQSTNTDLLAITSLVISAGTWDVFGNVCGYISPVTSSVNQPGINCNINDSVSFLNDGFEGYAFINQQGAGTRTTTLTSRRYIVETDTTIYLLGQCRFGEFNYCDFWGNLTAKQVS